PPHVDRAITCAREGQAMARGDLCDGRQAFDFDRLLHRGGKPVAESAIAVIAPTTNRACRRDRAASVAAAREVFDVIDGHARPCVLGELAAADFATLTETIEQ